MRKGQTSGEVRCAKCKTWYPIDYLIDGLCAYCDGRMEEPLSEEKAAYRSGNAEEERRLRVREFLARAMGWMFTNRWRSPGYEPMPLPDPYTSWEACGALMEWSKGAMTIWNWRGDQMVGVEVPPDPGVSAQLGKHRCKDMKTAITEAINAALGGPE